VLILALSTQYSSGGIKEIELATQKYVCKIELSMGAFI
jgi:hypothetical protein